MKLDKYSPYFFLEAHMSISNLTALIIATRDVRVSAAGPVNGKWVGWITLGEEDRYRPLLNSEPIYDSADAATDAMNKVIEDVRLLNEEKQTTRTKRNQ